MKLTEEQILQRNLSRLLSQGLKQYELIENGDRILIGLSGGKDSLCLTDLLARRSKIKRPDFTVEALHIRMENVDYETDTTYLETFCKEREVRLHVITSAFEPDRDTKRTPCFLCSWTRRKALFEFAQKNHFQAIALGHHNDDLLCTLLLNLTFQGNFSTMPAKLVMKKMPLKIIRPLCKIPETTLKTWAESHGYKPQLKRCPYEHDSNRTQIRDIMQRLTQLNPEVRYSLWHALEKENKLVET